MGFFKDLFGSVFGKKSSGGNVNYYRGPIKCPRCGYLGVYSEEQGFSFRDAFWGNMLFGRMGWLIGFRNKGKIRHVCQYCGYKWVED